MIKVLVFYLFIYLFIRSFIHSFIHSFMYLFICLFIYLFCWFIFLYLFFFSYYYCYCFVQLKVPFLFFPFQRLHYYFRMMLKISPFDVNVFSWNGLTEIVQGFIFGVGGYFSVLFFSYIKSSCSYFLYF